MGRLKLLQVTGGAGDYVIGPYRRFVTVVNDMEFIGSVRAQVQKELIQTVLEGGLQDNEQANLLSTLKVRLFETGLDDYPETPEAQNELYLRFTQEKENVL